MQLQQQLLDRKRCKISPSYIEFGEADLFRKKRRKLLASQEAKFGFDISSCAMRYVNRWRIHSSPTGSPSIAIELATWLGIASMCRL